jgi:hypothetical protein
MEQRYLSGAADDGMRDVCWEIEQKEVYGVEKRTEQNRSWTGWLKDCDGQRRGLSAFVKILPCPPLELSSHISMIFFSMGSGGLPDVLFMIAAAISRVRNGCRQ